MFKFKLKRFVKISFIICSILIIKISFFHFDLLCNDYNYDYQIKLKNVNIINSQNTSYSVAKWRNLICNTFSIYSSFIIDKQIVTIGFMQVHQYKYCKFVCHFNQRLIQAQVEILTESSYKKYSSIKIKCHLNEEALINAHTKKLFVQIKMHNQDNINCQSDLIKIERIYNTKQRLPNSSKNLTVCVRPLFGPFTAITSLLEFIAFYKANHVNKFVFYNLSTSSQVDSLLSSMKSFVDVLQFDLPIKTKDIHVEGQIAAMADCLLRNANDFVIFVDIDEFIVTFHHENLKTFIQSKINDSIGSFIFSNTFFCSQFNKEQRNVFPRILHHKMRQTSECPRNERTKLVIVKPLAVMSQGVHVVWKWNNLYGDLVNVYVDRNEAMLFHYRSCCSIWQTLYKWNDNIRLLFKIYYDFTIADNRMNKFANEIFAFFHRYIQVSFYN